MSYYPPGMTTGRSRTNWKVPQMCEHGHVWTTPMFINELGGAFYVDIDSGPVCPHCDALDLGNPDLAERAYNLIVETHRWRGARRLGGNRDGVVTHVGPEEQNYGN